MKPIKIYNNTDFPYIDIGHCIDLLPFNFEDMGIGIERYFDFENKKAQYRINFVNMKSLIKGDE